MHATINSFTTTQQKTILILRGTYNIQYKHSKRSAKNYFTDIIRHVSRVKKPYLLWYFDTLGVFWHSFVSHIFTKLPREQGIIKQSSFVFLFESYQYHCSTHAGYKRNSSLPMGHDVLLLQQMARDPLYGLSHRHVNSLQSLCSTSCEHWLEHIIGTRIVNCHYGQSKLKTKLVWTIDLLMPTKLTCMC